MNKRPTMMSHQQQPRIMNLNPNLVMNQVSSQSQPQMVPMNPGYGPWVPPPQFQNPNPNPGAMKPPLPAFKKSLRPRSNWKGKNTNKNKPNDKRWNELQKSVMAGSTAIGISGDVNIVRGGRTGGLGNSNFISYQPPTLNELQHQNRLKARKFFAKKKFNKNNNTNMMKMDGNNKNFNKSMSAPFAPRNSTSFIIRAKKSGGIASLVSPSPMTPAVLPTPILSPSREVLVDMAKEEWGVDGYGSMKGLIRLRSPGHEMEGHEDDVEDEGGSSESDVEEHVEVERRLDHDLSRFEMIYNPNEVGAVEHHNVLENRVDDQDTHIAQLEGENLILKERLFLMERELGELRSRILFLERRENKGEEINEEVVDNDYEHEGESHGEETHSMEDNNEDISEDNITHDEGSCKQNGVDGHNSEHFEAAPTAEKKIRFGFEKNVEENDDGMAALNKKSNIEGVTKNDESIDEDKAEEDNVVEDIEEINNNKNKCLDAVVMVPDKVNVESSERIAKGDICLEEIELANGRIVLQNDVAK